MTPKLLASVLAVSIPILLVSNAFGQKYEVPPSDVTSSYVPYISDSAMEQCVILYNKAKWLSDEIEKMQVDNYSQASVDAYNKEVSTHTSMLVTFNKDCAGKQSESAYKAAQQLNKKGQIK